jgi:hypothetical protein
MIEQNDANRWRKFRRAGTPGVDRRSFLHLVGMAGAGLATLGLTNCATGGAAAQALDPPDPPGSDTVVQIFTAALIAEDLATTMYYNSLIGPVIQDPNLAGPGGSATNTANGSFDNVGYLQGALLAEVAHANLFRSLLGLSGPPADPYQTFYFPAGTFDNLQNFLPILLALESAFVGAYLAATHEFALMAARIPPYAAEQHDPSGTPYKSNQIAFFAEVAASILGVEAEHRALARAIPSVTPGNTTFAGINVFPADNLNYEQSDNIATVFNGPNSAAAALTPFLTPGAGRVGYALSTALANLSTVAPSSIVQTTGGLPSA